MLNDQFKGNKYKWLGKKLSLKREDEEISTGDNLKD